ncbi:MAG: MFS transporter [Chlamydiota bacterium]
MNHTFIEKHRLLYASIIFALASLFLFFEMALQVSPSIMTNQLMSEFNIHAATLGIMASCYFYSYTLMQIPSGLLYDHFGPRLLISLSCFVCSLGALFFGLSHSVVFLAIGRFLLGVGSAFAFVGVLTISARWFAPALFALFVGITQFLSGIGAVAGSLPLAYAVDHYGWRHTITFLGCLGFIIALLCALFIRNRPPQEAEIHEDHYRLGIKKSFKEVLKQGQTWSLAVYSFSNWAPALIFPALWGVPYLMVKYQITNTQAAFATSMVWIGVAIFSPILGWASDKLQRRKSLLTFCTALGLLSSLILLFTPNLSFISIYILLLLLGGASSGNLLCFAVAKDNNRPSVTSTAMGFNNMAVVLGGAVFQPIVGAILSKSWDGITSHGLPVYTADNYTLALLTVPFCYLLGLVTTVFFIKETFCKQKYDSYSDQLQ